MNSTSRTAHELASAYATQVTKRLGLTDEMSVARGDAEMVWDLAYDAFMYRTQPGLPLVGGGKPAPGGRGGSYEYPSKPDQVIREIETDNTYEEDGTIFMGGRL